MHKLHRDVERAAKAEAGIYGATIIWEHAGKHFSLTVILQGKKRIVGMCGTPRSGDNMVHWVKQRVRQCVKEMKG